MWDAHPHTNPPAYIHVVISHWHLQLGTLWLNVKGGGGGLMGCFARNCSSPIPIVKLPPPLPCMVLNSKKNKGQAIYIARVSQIIHP